MIQREFRPVRKCGYKTASDGDIDIAFPIAYHLEILHEAKHLRRGVFVLQFTELK